MRSCTAYTAICCWHGQTQTVRGHLVNESDRVASGRARGRRADASAHDRSRHNRRDLELEDRHELARLYCQQGKTAAAARLVEPVLDRFTEGHDTAI